MSGSGPQCEVRWRDFGSSPKYLWGLSGARGPDLSAISSRPVLRRPAKNVEKLEENRSADCVDFVADCIERPTQYLQISCHV